LAIAFLNSNFLRDHPIKVTKYSPVFAKQNPPVVKQTCQPVQSNKQESLVFLYRPKKFVASAATCQRVLHIRSDYIHGLVSVLS